MGRVTIEGSLSPCVELARGARRTVTVTDHIRRLVAGGFVTVVAGSLDDEPAPVEPEEAPKSAEVAEPVEVPEEKTTTSAKRSRSGG